MPFSFRCSPVIRDCSWKKTRNVENTRVMGKYGIYQSRWIEVGLDGGKFSFPEVSMGTFQILLSHNTNGYY